MKISLIHPSRGRAEKSVQTVKKWFDKSSDNNIEVIVSNDLSDDYESYRSLYKNNFVLNNCSGNKVISLIKEDNNSVVEATNRAARLSSGGILIYLSDDFDCPDGWDDLVRKEFEGATGPRLVKVDDCLQPFYARVLTIPIMNRALYERLGYFWHPDYKSMFVDEDLFWTANKLGALWSAPHLKFPHNHVSVGKAEDDETYRRSAANWNQGQEVFNRRKRTGFQV